jgi:hypothetical protein
MPISGNAFRKRRPRAKKQPKLKQEWEPVEKKTKTEFELSLRGPKISRSSEVTKRPKKPEQGKTVGVFENVPVPE